MLGIILLIVGGTILLLVLLALAGGRSKRCPRCGKRTLAYRSQEFVAATPLYRTIEYTYVCSNCGNVVKRRVRSPRDNGLGGGRGPFIGGFGGFGGGRSGGGSFGGGFGGGSFGGGGAGSRW